MTATPTTSVDTTTSAVGDHAAPPGATEGARAGGPPRPPTGPGRARRAADPVVRTAGEYLALGGAVLALLALMVRPWGRGWAGPLVYRNDALATLSMVDAAGWTGTARGAPGLAFPHGAGWVDFPLGADRVHLVMYRLADAVTGDRVAAFDLVLVAGFVAVAWAAHGVLRSLGVGAVLAGATAVVFTLAPYHLDRVVAGHLFLAGYVAVPLGVLLALWSSDGSLVGPDARRRRVWALAWVLLVGSASAYYAAFAVVGVLAVGAALAVRRGSLRALLVPGLVAAGVVVVLAANLAGDAASAASQGWNPEPSARPVADSEEYALRPASLAVPPADHRVGPLAAVGGRFADALDRPGGGYVGLAALAGLGVIGVAVLRTGRRSGTTAGAPGERPLMLRLAVIGAATVGVATAGGAGLLLAVGGFGQIRVWSRVSIVVMFLGLVALAVVLDRRLSGAPPRRTALVGVGLVALAVVDQIGAAPLPDHEREQAALAADRAVGDGIAATVAADAAVFQHPPVAFPGGVTDRGAPMYAHLGPWAVGPPGLRWSAGAMQGRGGDWRMSWARQPPATMAAGLAAAGFDAVMVDRRIAAPAGPGGRSGADTADALVDLLGDPAGTSPDGSRVWFDLRPVRERMVAAAGAEQVDGWGRRVVRPIGVRLSGAEPAASTPEGTRLLDADAQVSLADESGDAAPVVVEGLVRPVDGAGDVPVRLSWDGGSRSVAPDAGGEPFRVRLPVSGGAARMELTAASRLALSGLTVVDAGLDADVAAMARAAGLTGSGGTS